MGHLANLDPNTKDSQWDLIYKIAAAVRSLVTGGSAGSNSSSSSTSLESSKVVSGAVRGFSVSGMNTSASDQYIMVFDSATVPANGTVTPVAVLLASAGYQFSFNWNGGRSFSNGIAVCNSTTLVSGGNVTKTIGSADCLFDINYRT